MSGRDGGGIAERVVRGDVRGVARAITMIEEQVPAAVDVLRHVFASSGNATTIGFTGSPGAGKSSLVDRVVRSFRKADRRVGVVAVDPSSAYSGGAILGDRVRMQDHAVDPGVFIRSMATRGHLGGLSRCTRDAVDVLDAAGFDPVLIETVGVGQDEIDVVRAADVVCVVLVPGMGDDIQAIKAGILEIADLFVVNKSDRPGADRLISELRYMLDLVEDTTRPRPEILKTVATTGDGIEELRGGIERFLRSRGTEQVESRRRERAESRFRGILSDRLLRRVLGEALRADAYDDVVRRIADRKVDPYTAVEELLEHVEVR